MQCGPKLPPQRRPRSVTSVPAEYSRPLLSINTQVWPNPLDDDFLGSASSPGSTNIGHSLPVSPMLQAFQPQFDPRPSSVTPLDSPVTINLENFDSYESGLGYIHLVFGTN